MATTQSASKSSKSSSGKKPAAKPVPAKSGVAELKQAQAVKAQASAEAAPGIPSEQIAGEFSPLKLHIEGTPLARREIAEKLVELAPELGIKLQTSDNGHIITEEQRQGERRQSDRDRRTQQEQDEKAASAVTAILSGQAPAEQPQAPEGEGQPAAPEGGETDQPQAAAPEVPDAFQAELAELAKKYNMPVPQIGVTGGAATPRSGRPNQNGITRPGSDTVTGKVWRCADELTAQMKQPVPIDKLKQHPELRLVNDHTIRTQYARWRQFNGVKGRVSDPNATPRTPKAAAAPAAPKVAFPEMSDSTFMKFQEDEREGTLPEEMKPWMESEKARRDAIRAAASQTKAPQAASNVPDGPMADEVYNKMLGFERNNTLPENWKAALVAEKARRGEK